MDQFFTFQIKNRAADLEALKAEFAGALKEFSLPADAVFAIDLILDEIVTNIIKYGFADDAEHDISIQLRLAEDRLVLTVEDDGRFFNPLEHPAPATDLRVEDRTIGGLGIHLLREMLDGCEYARTPRGNRMTFTKKLEP